jgi:hypothetical protein
MLMDDWVMVTTLVFVNVRMHVSIVDGPLGRRGKHLLSI